MGYTKERRHAVGTRLQTGRSRVRGRMRGINFLNLPNPSILTSPWGAEMSTRSREIIFIGSKARPVHKADNLTAICELIV
jgi:hypothetical protein